MTERKPIARNEIPLAGHIGRYLGIPNDRGYSNGANPYGRCLRITLTVSRKILTSDIKRGGSTS